MKPSQFALIPLSLAASACTTPATNSDMGARDLPAWRANLTGRWAASFSFHFAQPDAGAAITPFPLLAIFQSTETPTNEVDSRWELCAFPIPGLGTLTDDYLSPAMISVTNGSVRGDGDGAHYLQPPLTFVAGAQLANPDSDPLPTNGANLCADATSTGCVVANPQTKKPAVSIMTNGLTPDADLVYVVARVRLGFDAVVHEYGVLGGAVDPASVEWHVVGCHLASGADCAPADVAALEAARPALALSQGTMQWSFQGTYLTCPTFESDPEGTINGTGINDVGGGGDGGVTGPIVFSNGVQRDLDAMGCATGGCHETRTAPNQMHLVYHPMGDQVRSNYEAALPWTMGPPTGGRFVNEVSLPPSMRARWLDWIANGTPF